MPIVLETVPCGVCGGEQFTPLFMARDYLYGNVGEWPVAQCQHCQVILMHPRIPPAAIDDYYPKDYYTTTAAVRAPDRLTWRRAAKDAAAERFFGYTIPRADPLRFRLAGMLLLPFTRHWTATSKYAQWVPHGRLLDIGTGNGQWLSDYQRLGWQVTGVEPSPASAALATAAGHEVFRDLFAAAFPDQSFDAVTMWDALEHIHNPAEVLMEVRRVLKPGGLVYISVPNWGSWYGRRFRDRWFMFTAPVHYFHYTAETITRLLALTRFERPRLRYPIGDVGLRFTLRNLTAENSGARRWITWAPIWKILAGLDMFLPNGHLLAIATRP